METKVIKACIWGEKNDFVAVFEFDITKKEIKRLTPITYCDLYGGGARYNLCVDPMKFLTDEQFDLITEHLTGLPFYGTPQECLAFLLKDANSTQTKEPIMAISTAEYDRLLACEKLLNEIREKISIQ